MKENKLYIIGTDKKNKRVITASAEDIINNALEQEKQGVKPCYAWINHRTMQAAAPLGWLVWNSYDYGCGVVYRRSNGKMIICTGVQGDFGCFTGDQAI